MNQIKNLLYLLSIVFALSCITISCQESDELEENSALVMSSEFAHLKFTGDYTAEGNERKVIITQVSQVPQATLES